MSKKLQILIVIMFGLLLLISFSSVVYLYENRAKIFVFLKKLNYGHDEIYDGSIKVGEEYIVTDDTHIYWAKKIMNGGYILHFRHAERDKWIDVNMYDAMESDLHNNGLNESRYAEKDYFGKAVCLNERGKIQAKAMGENLKYIGLPIGRVHSSVSCRARQTADLAFGGYDQLHRILVHTETYNEDEKTRIKTLTDLYLNFSTSDKKNTIVSAHNSVIKCDMFINDKCPNKPSLEEGGFYVLRKTKDGLVFEHEFHYFKQFSRVFFER